MLDDDGMPVLVTEPDVEGEIMLRAPWPSMMRMRASVRPSAPA